MTQQDRLVKDFQKRVAAGLSVEDAVDQLKALGLSPVESMRVIMEVYALSLGEAKSIVVRSPQCTAATSAADALHEDIVETEDCIDSTNRDTVER